MSENQEGKQMTNEEKIPGDEPRKMVHARISPRFINALAPMMRQVFEMAHSDFFFMNQVNTDRFGSYLIPVENADGVILAVVDSYRVLAVLDPKGQASEPMKVHFPDKMLDALQPKLANLSTQDGEWFAVEMEPKAHAVFVTDICAVVTLEKEAEKKWKGCGGSWANMDYGNMRDMNSYRAEPADIDFIRKVIGASVSNRGSSAALQLNPRLMTPMTEAADRLGVILDLSFATDSGATVLRSVGDVEMFGLIMPTNYQPHDREPTIAQALREKPKDGGNPDVV